MENINNFLQEIMDKIPRIIKIRYQSLRKITKYFEIFLGIQMSHQIIKIWSNKNHEETINKEEFEYLAIIHMMGNF